MEVYVDDMLVKSTTMEHHLRDLKETFSDLRLYNMKLNPEKCTFGVEAGKFLGFMVSRRGIEANPKKGSSNTRDAIPKIGERHLKVNRANCNTTSIYFQSS